MHFSRTGIRIVIMRNLFKIKILIYFILPALTSCKIKNNTISAADINALNLRRGDLVLCGVSGNKFGSVDFGTSCSAKEKSNLELAVALLHSFEYDEAEKIFARIIDEEPGCAMAYWGV
ncbi:MAG TPA: hypothetical protein VIL90_02515, partial [Puia sp.]